MLPSKSLTAGTEAAVTNYGRSKENLTSSVFSYATAKLKMDFAIIGKSRNPRIIKTISRNQLFVKYLFF